MTKEAKIGLLLGLGFIVAIAVVLRDVHQVGQDGLEETLGVGYDSVDRDMPDLSVVVERLTDSVDESQQTLEVAGPSESEMLVERGREVEVESQEVIEPVRFIMEL